MSIVLVTAPSVAVASHLARDLVTERLAAYVNVVPGVISIYGWEGQLEQADEVLMVIKTRRLRYDALEQYVRMHHPYDTPEIVKIPADRVTPAYWAWVMHETTHG